MDHLYTPYNINKVKAKIESRKNDYIKYVLPQKQYADIIINYYII